MYLSYKFIGIRKWVKGTKRTQADQGKYFTYWAKRCYVLMFKICFTMLCWFNDVSCKYFTYWAKRCYVLMFKICFTTLLV
jgi:hypothetical protein